MVPSLSVKNIFFSPPSSPEISVGLVVGWRLGKVGYLPRGRTESWVLQRNRKQAAIGSEGKASACNAGDMGSIPGSGRSPGEGNGNALRYSCLKNPMDRGAWWVTVHGVTKSQTRLHFHFLLTLPSEKLKWECGPNGVSLFKFHYL